MLLNPPFACNFTESVLPSFFITPAMNTNEFLKGHNSSSRSFEGGSLCIWGNWFGRPMDNFHKLDAVSFDKELNKLTLTFDNKERLTVWNAENITDTKGHFQIDKADKVLWEWYYYEKPQTEENIFFEEYERIGDTINFKTNVNWYKKSYTGLTSKKPAVFMA